MRPALSISTAASGYERQECAGHLASLKAVLIQYPVYKLGDWNWILVSSEEWQPLLRGLQIDRRSVAFSNVKQRTTVLEEAIFLPHAIRTEELARHLQVPTGQLVTIAVSHELGHILCRDSNEATAYRVAEQLRQGKPPECGRSLTRMEELLYQQSRALGQPTRR